MHGGTLNDIAIHAVNLLPWITGLNIVKVAAARTWNARLKEVPHFKEAAQCMLVMENGCGVLGDVSYLIPDSFNCHHPLYWALVFWGSKGVIQHQKGTITFWKDGEDAPRTIKALPSAGNCLNSFINDIRGISRVGELNTDEILLSTRQTLLIQEAADSGRTNVPLL
jgi:predicted dehydrogenase